MKRALLSFIIFLFLTYFNVLSADKDIQNDVYWGYEQSPLTNELKTITINSEGHMYIGVWGGGVYKSEDESASFTQLNSGLTNLYVTSVQFDSTGNLFAATHGGGVFKSTNDGAEWTAVNNGLRNLKVKDIAFDHDGRCFAATKGHGVFLLEKGSDTWKEINHGLRYRDVNRLIVTLGSGWVLAGTNGGGVYRTKDTGKTWHRANTGIDAGIITDFYQDNLMTYAATLGQGILTSVSEGSTWSNKDTLNMPKNVTCISFTNEGEMLAGTIDDGLWYYDIFVHSDWRKSNNIFNGINDVVTMPGGDVFALVSFDGLKRSTDRAKNFYGVPFLMQSLIQNVIAYGSTLYCIADNSIFRSDDRGETWTKLDAPFQFAYSMCLDSAKVLYAGSEAGVWSSADKGENFSQVGDNFSDSTVYYLETSSDGYLYAGSGHLFKKWPTSISWDRLNVTGVSDPPPSVSFIGVHPNGAVYSKDMDIDALFRSVDDSSQVWDVVFFDDNSYNAMSVKANGDTYLASNDGLLVLDDQGNSIASYKDFHQNAKAIGAVSVDKNQNIFSSVKFAPLVLSSDNYAQRRDTVLSGIWWSTIADLASSDNGFTYASNSQIYRHVDSLEMPKPQAMYPPKDTNGINLLPELKWHSADKANVYHFQFAMDMDFEVVMEEAYLADTVYQLENELQHREIYSWRVRSKHNSSYSEWSDPMWFSTIFEPVVLHLPSDDTTSLPLNVSLHWHPIEEINSYMVQAATDSLFENIVFEKDDVTDTTAEVSGLTYATEYFWRVRAKTIDVIGQWSEVWSFTTLLPPPNLRLPPDKSYGHEKQVKMEWDAVEGGTKYSIQISEKEDFSSLFFSGAAQNNDSHIIELLEYFTTYYWRIRALDEFERPGAWSQPWSFTTIIDSTTLRKPENEISNTSNTITFQWDGKHIADAYHLQAAKDENMTDLVINDSNISEAEYKAELDYYTRYYWRVALKAGGYKGKWSVLWNFKTGIAAPELQSPPNNAKNRPTVLYLIWNERTFAQEYHLQVALDEIFADKIYEDDKISITQEDLIDLDLSTTYYWRVRAKYDEGYTPWSEVWNFTTTDVETVYENNPVFEKIAAYPNPFSESTRIEFSLKKLSEVNINIYDIFGRMIFSENLGRLNLGENGFNWTAANLPQGVYNVVINAGENSAQIKAVLVR